MNAVPKWLAVLARVLQVGLLIVSTAVLLVPPVRTPPMHDLQRTLLTIECVWMAYRAWRRGMLGMRPEDSVDRLMERGPVTSGLLERASLLCGFVALFVLAL